MKSRDAPGDITEVIESNSQSDTAPRSSPSMASRIIKSSSAVARQNARLEPTDLNLEELARKKHNQAWGSCSLNEQVELIRAGLTPTTFLINPNSLAMQKWGIVVLVALIYTALVTPFEVSYLTTSLNALFFVNRIIDVVFLCDMFRMFFTKIEIPSRTGGTMWIRDKKLIAIEYLKGWFWIDLVSVLPFDILGAVDDSPAFQQLKSVRIIRLLRLLKLVRIVKASRMISQWQNYVAISYSYIALIKLSVGLVCMAHWLACVWGLEGKMLGTQFRCEKGNPVPIWKENITDPTEGVSWITALYHPENGKTSPDSPCNPWHLYAASLHWSIMTITSIGYGDIVPVRFEEYLIECLCMLLGAITWAFIIGSACGVLSNLDPYRVQFEHTMDALNYMLEDQNFPREMRVRFREYFRQSQHIERLKQYNSLSAKMSSMLKGEVALHTTQRWLIRVWYFTNCRRGFIIQVAQSLVPHLYAQREEFPFSEVLYIVERGLCARGGNVLCVGHCWGEDMILESKSLRDRTTCVALTYCEVWSLTKSQLKQICDKFPKEKARIRKATVTLAVIRGIIRLAEQIRIENRIKQRKPKYDLADVALGGLVQCTRALTANSIGGWPVADGKDDKESEAGEPGSGRKPQGDTGGSSDAQNVVFAARIKNLETAVQKLTAMVQSQSVLEPPPPPLPPPPPQAEDVPLSTSTVDDIAEAIAARLTGLPGNGDNAQLPSVAWQQGGGQALASSAAPGGASCMDGPKKPLKSLPHPWTLKLGRQLRRKHHSRVAAMEQCASSNDGGGGVSGSDAGDRENEKRDGGSDVRIVEM